jgi:hypothetical protein
MSLAPPPPGGPLPPDFGKAIHQLARQAREEDLRAEEELRKRGERRKIRTFIRLGLALITLEVALYVYLHERQKYAVATKPAAAVASRPKTCTAATNRAYWEVVAYVADHGHPPATLAELVGPYVDRLPFDPVSGKPLEYSTDGDRFTIRCASAAPAER